MADVKRLATAGCVTPKARTSIRNTLTASQRKLTGMLLKLPGHGLTLAAIKREMGKVLKEELK